MAMVSRGGGGYGGGHDIHHEAEVEIDLGLTENQRRLLYLISLYTRPAKTANDKEEWIRRMALLVLVYQGIVKQALDYDYAPASTLINDRRVYFNMSQEGASDIDFLREEGLLNGLKLASANYQPVSCYQISQKGVEIIKRIPRADRDAVHTFVYFPDGPRELMRVEWRGGKFLLVAGGGREEVSTVLDCEDVSYVGSAYLPQCLRFGGRPTLSNAHRATECAKASSNIRDVLDEIITLNSVSVVVAEYIPFGANNVVQVNGNLGSGDRVQGGFFTALIDNDSSGTKFVVDPGLTSVNILDYSSTRHVNFEADIHFPEDPGIVQVETFGVSMNADGTIFYGMQIEAVMDRIKDNISLDMLSRLLVDVSLDSSTIVDSLISGYQRKLMNLIYAGNAASRDKVNLIIANEITPHLTAEEYMDKGDYENELKQVLGDTRAAFDISEHDTLVFGSNGLLIAGPNARHHEPLLCSYMQFMSMDLFIRNFFNRMFLLNDNMRELRSAINNYLLDPLSMNKIHDRLQVLSDDVRMMGEILGFLVESLEGCEIPPQPQDPAGKALYARLQIADLAAQLSMRVLDLKKLVDGTRLELAHLRHLGKIVFDSRQLKVHEATLVAARQLNQHSEVQERTAMSLRIIMLILTGLLAFAVLERLTGTWTVMDSDWFKDFADPIIKKNALIWFLVNMGFWFLVAWAAFKVFTMLAFATQGVITLRVRVMQKVQMEAFNRYIASKNMSLEERNYDERSSIVRVTWQEIDVNKRKFGGAPPKVTVEYDRVTSYMHSVTIEYNRRLAKKGNVITGNELRTRISADMEKANVFIDKGFSFRDETIDVLADVFTTKANKDLKERMAAKFQK